jgi:hypothetical protein
MDERDYFWRLVNTPGYWQDAARDLVCAANLLKKDYRASPRLGFARRGALSDGLRMQERSYDGLLDLTKPQANRVALDISCATQLALDDSRPRLLLTFVLLGVRDRHQLAQSLRKAVPAGRIQENSRPHERCVIPLLGFAQRQRERSKDASCLLEALQLGPLGVEDLGQVRVE